ncbi:hypothetical protein L9F63_025319, partial [Diploptera punctata]
QSAYDSFIINFSNQVCLHKSEHVAAASVYIFSHFLVLSPKSINSSPFFKFFHVYILLYPLISLSSFLFQYALFFQYAL